ncbi:MAG: N-6 DNA methylase [Candidatus Bathyarchaeia archaeon]|nr:N-6 DNA methylase [Candidatus Bathyarchaeia archaeon]
MSIRTRERTLYDYIGRTFGKYGCRYVTQVGIGAREPDLVIEFDGTRVVSEVKIDTDIKREEAIVDAYAKALALKTPHALALLFPKYVRDIPPSELERVYPNLEVSALILTGWLSDRMDLTTLDKLASVIAGHYRDWLRTKIPRVNYDLVVDVAQGAIREIGAYLRAHLVRRPILDSALAVIGRFDIYKSLLEDVSGIAENEAKLYVADIASYILANQLLFYHILSEKLGYDRLPDVNPITPPTDLLTVLDKLFEKVRSKYSRIFGLNLFPLLMETKDLRIVYSTAKLVSKFKALRPQHIREDLFGRLYHETIPPETRKNLGAFYTKPEAAKLLATLAVDKWDAKVLDPACGSGTLLVETYHRKAQLAPSMNRDQIHKKFIAEDIYGIDVMHFAAHMTSTNLSSQNIRVHAEPNVFSRDGVEALAQPTRQNYDPPTMEQTLDKWLETMTGVGIPDDFDVVIMNPPFTRRERIPDEIKKLSKLVPEVKGKTGYWAYFVIPADKVLKQNGVLAVVIPEEFFVGRSAKSVRKYLFDRGYVIEYLVRSAAEVAFSESAHYRDYLIVLRKGVTKKPLVVTILKGKLHEMREQVGELALKIKEFRASSDTRLSLAELESLKVFNIEELIARHIANLKPLVGFNTVEAHTLNLQLLDEMKDKPTLGDLEKKRVVKIRVYNPGQYKTRGVEKFARKLFAGRYGAMGPSVTFLIDRLSDNEVRLGLRRAKMSATLALNATIPTLRTYSKVKHMDITQEEELAITEPNALPGEVMKLTGLIPLSKVIEAAKDIKCGYDDLTGNFLLVRKSRLTSSELYWLVFYSDNKVLGTTSALLNMHVEDIEKGKALAVYLNSSISLLQLIAFMAETEGAWVTLHGNQVWAHVHVPDIENLDDKELKKAVSLFAEISKLNVKPLYQRIRDHDNLQKRIDELALEMTGLNNWKNMLDELYDVIANELETMQKYSKHLKEQDELMRMEKRW